MWMHQTSHYFSYLLRLWQERQEDNTVWRASLESVQTHDLHYFSTLEELVAFLVAVTGPPQSDPRG